MKIKSIAKLLFHFLVSIALSIASVSIAGAMNIISGNGNIPIILGIILGVCVFAGVFWVFRNDCDYVPKAEPTKAQVILEKEKSLKWSALMGPCTRKRAMEIIKGKRKAGRLPTVLEIKEDINSPYYMDFHCCERSYWLQDENTLIVRAGSQLKQNVPENVKSHFVIVWEV